MGAYLLALGRHEEAIRWPERATAASRYYTNAMINRAREYFELALRRETSLRVWLASRRTSPALGALSTAKLG